MLTGSSILGEEGKILRVGVPGLQAFNKEQLERKTNRQFLQDLIEKNMGRSMGLRFESVANGAPGPGAGMGPRAALGSSTGASHAAGAASAAGSSPDAPGGNGTGAAGERKRREASSEGIQKIADLFGGDVVGPA